ncbi:MAG: hypothetical protein JO111_19435 [Caulobacteraceae bacterium]|nr:hypothetical protein [Caulobacteraceae bacterium]
MGNFTGMVVGVTFWVAVVAVVVLPVYFKYLERGRMHETLRVAIERGQPIPPELISAIQSATARIPPGPDRDLRNGLILLAWGLGFVGLGYGLWYGLMSVNDIAAYVSGGCVAGFGAIPGLIGVAYLVLWALRRGRTARA